MVTLRDLLPPLPWERLSTLQAGRKRTVLKFVSLFYDPSVSGVPFMASTWSMGEGRLRYELNKTTMAPNFAPGVVRPRLAPPYVYVGGEGIYLIEEQYVPTSSYAASHLRRVSDAIFLEGSPIGKTVELVPTVGFDYPNLLSEGFLPLRVAGLATPSDMEEPPLRISRQPAGRYQLLQGYLHGHPVDPHESLGIIPKGSFGYYKSHLEALRRQGIPLTPGELIPLNIEMVITPDGGILFERV